MQNSAEHSFFRGPRARANSSSVIPIQNSSKTITQTSPRARTLSLALSAQSYDEIPPLCFFQRQEEIVAFSIQHAPSPIARELAQSLFNIERTLVMIDPDNQNPSARDQIELLHEANTFFRSIESVIPSEVMQAQKRALSNDSESQLSGITSSEALMKTINSDETSSLSSDGTSGEIDGIFACDP